MFQALVRAARERDESEVFPAQKSLPEHVEEALRCAVRENSSRWRGEPKASALEMLFIVPVLLFADSFIPSLTHRVNANEHPLQSDTVLLRLQHTPKEYCLLSASRHSIYL